MSRPSLGQLTMEKTIPPPMDDWPYLSLDRFAVDLITVRQFIEAVMLDDASFEAGLWQGEMPKRALAAMDRIIERVRPNNANP